MSKLIIRMSKLIIRMSELIKWTSNLVNIVFVTLYTVYFTFLSLYTINIFMSQTVTPTATHSQKDATEWSFGSFSSFWLTPFSSIQQTNPFMLRFPVIGSRCTFPRRFFHPALAKSMFGLFPFIHVIRIISAEVCMANII